MKTFLIFILILLVILFIISKITDTLWFRIRSAKLAQRDREVEENDNINTKIIDGNKFLNDENRLLKIMEKIHRKEAKDRFIIEKYHKFTVVSTLLRFLFLSIFMVVKAKIVTIMAKSRCKILRVGFKLYKFAIIIPNRIKGTKI